MVLIFLFSSKNSTSSNTTSKRIIDQGITIYEKVSKKEVDHQKMIEKLNYPVRKLAHYSIYFLLGFFSYQLLQYTKLKKKELYAILLCLLYAFLDEFHQLFVNGRTGQIKDVIIDIIGAITAILITSWLLEKKNNDIAKKRENMI